MRAATVRVYSSMNVEIRNSFIGTARQALIAVGTNSLLPQTRAKGVHDDATAVSLIVAILCLVITLTTQQPQLPLIIMITNANNATGHSMANKQRSRWQCL